MGEGGFEKKQNITSGGAFVWHTRVLKMNSAAVVF